jgi:hypothetical protein
VHGVEHVLAAQAVGEVRCPASVDAGTELVNERAKCGKAVVAIVVG